MSDKAKPYSLAKLIKENELKKLNLLVDGTGLGIDKDDPNVFIIGAKDCELQAHYWVDIMIKDNHPRLPVYLNDDLKLFYPDVNNDDQFFFELVKNCKSNAEATQIIGLIMLVHGALSMAKKHGKRLNLYLEHPEVHLHPSRQSTLATWLIQTDKKYK